MRFFSTFGEFGGSKRYIKDSSPHNYVSLEEREGKWDQEINGSLD